MKGCFCCFCGIELKSVYSKIGHERFCKLNPNYTINLQNHIDKVSKRGLEASAICARRKAEQNPLNIIEEHHFSCCKCGKEYSLSLKRRDFNSGKYTKYCSRSCANSRKHSEETKKKISHSVKLEHTHVCPECGNQFMCFGTSKTSRCDKCLKKNYETRGRQKDVELHKSKCLRCGIDLFTKRPTDVFCYECAEKLQIKKHYLYTSDGRKIFPKSTLEKLKNKMIQKVSEGNWKGWFPRDKEPFSEIYFEEVLKSNHIEYEHNYYISKKTLGLNKPAAYCLDFNLKGKVDLEIDGKQHKYPSRMEHDKKRDSILTLNGWSIYRIEWNEIDTEEGRKQMKEKIDVFLSWYRKRVFFV